MTLQLSMNPTIHLSYGLHEDDAQVVGRMWEQLTRKAPRNRERSTYYEMENAVRQLGLTTPPGMRHFRAFFGWSAKAVDVMADRINLETFNIKGYDHTRDEYGLRQILEQNPISEISTESTTDALLHCCSFLIVGEGDPSNHEPKALITTKDALAGTGLWDVRRHGMSDFLSVNAVDDQGKPTDMVLYQYGRTLHLRREIGSAQWQVDESFHQLGLPVEVLRFRPRTRKKFGISRITPAVMSLHDAALRSVLRSEVTAELYSVPQRVLLGADEDVFTNADGTQMSQWEAVLGKIWAIPVNEDGQAPKIDHFAPASQEPHMKQLHQWAMTFSGETGVPLADLGVSVSEANPNSQAAYEAAREGLIATAEKTVKTWQAAWARTMRRAMVIQNDGDLPDDIVPRPHFRDVRYTSRAALADAASKTIASFPWMAESPIGLELFGFDSDFIERAQAEKERVEATSRMSQLLELARSRTQGAVDANTVAD